MARARLLKPSFFKNEELADLGMHTRLLFAGLWCLADRDGRLEDRPRRIKADVLPYDDCDVDAALTALHDRGFIRRYSVGGDSFILVLNFRKHQTPHVKEAASVIPAPDKSDASTRQVSDETSPISPLTSSFSLNPIPEALTPESTGGSARDVAADAAPPDPKPPIQAIPKTRELPAELLELRTAFESRGLRAPPLQASAEFQAARRLLKRAREPDELAACWQDVRAGDWGDQWMQDNLSFVSLDRNSRFDNWQAWKGGLVGSPKQRNNGRQPGGGLTDEQKRQRGITHA